MIGALPASLLDAIVALGLGGVSNTTSLGSNHLWVP